MSAFVSNFDKMPADGICGACGKPVPKFSPNAFYCCPECEARAWDYHHPYVPPADPEDEA